MTALFLPQQQVPRRARTVNSMNFPCPPLSPHRRDLIEREAAETCEDLLQLGAGDVIDSAVDGYERDSSRRWEHYDVLRSCRIDKADATSRSKTRNVFYFRSVTQVTASIDAVKEFFRVDGVGDQDLQRARVLEPNLLQSCVLHEVKRYNPQNPTIFLGIRWLAMKSSVELLRDRDYCLLECQQQFALLDGRRLFVQLLHSMNIDGCPDLEASHGFVRANMFESGFIFVEGKSDRQKLDVVQVISSDLQTEMISMVALRLARERLWTIERIKHIFRVRRAKTTAHEHSKHCSVCKQSAVESQQSLQHCENCGQLVCRRCKLVISKVLLGLGKRRLVICNHCKRFIHHNNLNPGRARSEERPIRTRERASAREI